MKIQNIAYHSALSTLYKTINAIIIIKIMAAGIGVGGLGEISNAFSLVGFVTIFCVVGVGAGITKYVAMSKSLIEINSIIRVSIALNLIVSVLMMLVCYCYANEISHLLFFSIKYGDLIFIISIFSLPLGLSVIALSVINGLSKAELISRYQLTSLVLGSIAMYILVDIYKLRGALVGLFVVPSAPILYVVYLCRKEFINFIVTIKFNINDFKLFKGLIKYSIITLASISVSSLVQFIYRADMQDSWGIEAVGNWQALLRISDGYGQVFLVFLMAYLLPNMARASDNNERIKFVNQALFFMCLSMAIIFTVIYFMREVIVEMALSKDFNEIIHWFKLQLISDFFRIISYIPGMIILALGRVKLSLMMELVQGCLLLVIGKVTISGYGAVGAVLGYLISYIIYCSIICLSYFFFLKKNLKK